jgi:2',3'-cyclic-nucleotide 2'-phosphodiesterase
MTPLEDPFRAAERELAAIPASVKVIVVDMHAEATSEKQAMGWFLDGKVSAVVGTHTHVATADAHVLPGGTAFITDVGMTGPHDSIIGMEKQSIIQRFLNALPARFEVAEGDVQMHAALIEADESTGRARSIEHLVFRAD